MDDLDDPVAAFAEMMGEVMTDDELYASFLSTVPLFQSFSKPEIAEVRHRPRRPQRQQQRRRR